MVSFFAKETLNLHPYYFIINEGFHLVKYLKKYPYKMTVKVMVSFL